MNVRLLHGGEPAAVQLSKCLSVTRGAEAEKGSAGAGPIVRWGAFAEEPEEGSIHTLNPLKPVLRTLHKPAMRDILAIHGILTGSEEPVRIEPGKAAKQSGKKPSAGRAGKPVELPRFERLYEVQVFHLEALSIWEQVRSAHWMQGAKGKEDHSTFREVAMDAAGFHIRRAVRQSVRSVYALGLDFAIVRVGIDAEGRTVILNVDPMPSLNDRQTELFAEAIIRFGDDWQRETERTNPPMLGADPEFLLVRPDGAVVPASRFMEREGIVGSDSIVLPGGGTAQPLAELRPLPSANPVRLTANLRTAMLEAARKIAEPDIAWVAGGMPVKGLALGGHIHISGIMLSSRLLRTLDNYVALPLSLCETEADRRRRPRYGMLGDFRRKRHGGFEYRTPASWLELPALALGTLCLVRVVADHYRELNGNPLYHRDVQRNFYHGERGKLLPVADSLWLDLRRTAGYARYRSELDALHALLFTREPVCTNGDFRDSWKITAPKREAPIENDPSFVLTSAKAGQTRLSKSVRSRSISRPSQTTDVSMFLARPEFML